MEVLNELQQSVTDKNNNEGSSTESEVKKLAMKNTKYNFRNRSIQKRIECEVRRAAPKRQTKPKSKPAPLSKYRRKTANARERYRMKEINSAFETLREKIPNFPIHRPDNKLTKITTLRLAMSYINNLSKLLNQQDNVPVTYEHLNHNNHHHHHNHYTQEYADPFMPYTRTPEPSLNVADLFARDALASNASSSSCRSELSEYPGDLLSEDGSMGDGLDSLSHFPSIDDPFDIFLESDGESLNFASDLSDQPTP